MVEYSEINVELSGTQWKKLKKCQKTIENKTVTTLRMRFKMFDGYDLSHELLLTTRRKTKLRNAFNNNMSTALKIFKAQTSKIIQSVVQEMKKEKKL